MNEKLIQFYNYLADKNLDDDQIDAQFRKHVGMSLSEVRQRLSPQAPGGAEIVREATEEAYTEPVTRLEEEGFMSASGDVVREALQGATFGTADEAEALVRSYINGTDYDTEIKQVRSDIAKFRTENPGLALTAEISGSFLVPGFFMSKLAKYIPKGGLGKMNEGEWIRNTLKRATIGGIAGSAEGFAYGLGTGEGSLSERVDQAIPEAKAGGTIGAIAGPTIGKATEVVGEAIRKRLPGQGGKGPPPIDDAGNVMGPESGPGAAFEGRQLLVRAAELDDVQLEDMAELLEDIAKQNPRMAEMMTVGDLFPDSGTGQMIAEVATQAAGPSRGASQKVYKSRSEYLPGLGRTAIKENIGRKMPTGKDPKKPGQRFKDRIDAQSKQKSQPFYDRASPVVLNNTQSKTLNDHLNRILDYGKDDPGSSALRKLWAQAKVRIPGILRANGIDETDFLGVFGDRASGNATISHWHTLKVLIGDKLKQKKRSADPFSAFDDSTLQRLYDDINKTLKDASEDYQIAARYHAGHEGMKEAFDAGIQAHKNKTLAAHEMKREFNKLKSTPEKKAYRLGYAFGMHSKIMGKPLKQMDVKRELGMFAEEEPQKLRILFKNEETAKRFLDQIDMLSSMDALSKSATKGSQTYSRQAAERMMKGSPGLVTSAIDMYNRTRGIDPLLTSTDDILSNQRFQETLGSVGPMINTMGLQRNRKMIQDLIAERKRLEQLMGRRQGYVAMTPGTFSPLLANESVQQYGGIPFDMAAGLLTPEQFRR